MSVAELRHEFIGHHRRRLGGIFGEYNGPVNAVEFQKGDGPLRCDAFSEVLRVIRTVLFEKLHDPRQKLFPRSDVNVEINDPHANPPPGRHYCTAFSNVKEDPF